MSSDKLYQLHDSLCHPVVTRIVHFLRTKNLVVSKDEVKNMIASSRICKPRFIRSNDNKLVKATQPFERLSIDFKGPLPSSTNNKYFLTITDEYSRFPFAKPCSDISSSTVIKCLCSVISVFGFPG